LLDFLKTWARSIYVLSVLSSVVILLSPKRMQKEVRFVLEMLILLCIIAPLISLLGKPLDKRVGAIGGTLSETSQATLEKFYEDEMARRIRELGLKANIPIAAVTLKIQGSFPAFKVGFVDIRLERPVDKEEIEAFRGSLSAYLGISREDVLVEVKP